MIGVMVCSPALPRARTSAGFRMLCEHSTGRLPLGTGLTCSSAQRSRSMPPARTIPASVRQCCIRFDPGCVLLARLRPRSHREGGVLLPETRKPFRRIGCPRWRSVLHMCVRRTATPSRHRAFALWRTPGRWCDGCQRNSSVADRDRGCRSCPASVGSSPGTSSNVTSAPLLVDFAGLGSA